MSRNSEQVQTEDNLVKITLPDQIMGDLRLFSNYDPERIQYYEIKESEVEIFMNELHRLQAIEEFISTVSAFKDELEFSGRSETEIYKNFDYDFEFSTLLFTVDRALFRVDITAEIIERGIVFECIRFQLYSRKPVGVTVKYVDCHTRRVFLVRHYPDEFK